jgi:hypothetical protein
MVAEGAPVAAQHRIYTIKAGLMDEWLVLFREKVAPLHEKFGIMVRTAWVDHENSQFIWVREFTGEGSLEEQQERYVNSPERAETIGDEPKRFIETMEVRLVESVPSPA